MKTAKKSKAGFIIRIAAVIFIVYFVVALVQLQLDLQKRRDTLAQLQAACEQQSQSNEEMETFLDGGNNDEYYERLAREKLGFVGAGERVYIDKSGN